METCILKLHEIGVVKFGDFTLKSGIQSPVYFDMRVITSYPKLLRLVSELLWSAVDKDTTYDHVCGVAYTGIPFATVISQLQDMPMLLRRKESKNYGTKQLVEGIYTPGQSCLIIEDVLVSGSSVYETVETLQQLGLRATDAIVFLDRQQGGQSNLLQLGVTIKPVLTLTHMLDVLERHDLIKTELVEEVLHFISQNNVTKIRAKSVVSPPPVNQRLSSAFEQREGLAVHPLVRTLLSIITSKRSNLCVSADVQNSEELLALAKQVGPHICLLKTHVDTLLDFTPSVTKELQSIAVQHNFLLFEDSKFVDIGATVKRQWEQRGAWADMVTAVPLAGEGLLAAIAKASHGGPSKGVVLVAEMSSEGALRSSEYLELCQRAAKNFPQLVLGFVCQSSVTDNPGLVQMSPGVSISASGDSLGQQYVSPEVSVGERGADIIIVGRGVTTAADPAATAADYQRLAYAAYLSRLETL
ncbi:Orotate phosphoribosyltransferase [Trinorchestia longiramus]|nr:Orotate phosphoribosyltransferase [Trinorchestia longiramus]